MKLNISDILTRLHIEDNNDAISTGSYRDSSIGAVTKTITSPVDGKNIASVKLATEDDYNKVIKQAQEAFKKWRTVPAPKRGEVIRQIGEALRNKKQELGTLVSYEMGKSLQEGYGEVQEMIDICDLAVGLSRQLSVVSKRPAPLASIEPPSSTIPPSARGISSVSAILAGMRLSRS